MNRILVGFLLIASILDASLTDIGLRLHLIGEANPIMAYLYEHAYIGFYAFKIVLPLSLFYLLARVRKSIVIKSLVNLSVLVYIGILGLHYFWITASFNLTA
ncbi:DUF5658 family protein [Paenibacillus koleovorans]|uniref:DUF5658 family protein n=1 Tax=Paenibacillus koleovorans TaxID=121608 RepID=UPI000FD8AEE1|nr:DUF5658 family protein [Paenibacillus koleovorans]